MKGISSVHIDTENIAKSTISDTGCGCCMSNIEPYEIYTLETYIEEMRDILEDAEKVLKARKKQFEVIGEKDREIEVGTECSRCDRKKQKSPFGYKTFPNMYRLSNQLICEHCIEEKEDWKIDFGKVVMENLEVKPRNE